VELVDEVKHEKMGDGEQKNLPVVSPNHSGETLQDAGRVQREQLSRILDVTDHAKSIDLACGAEMCPVDSAHNFLQWQADVQGFPVPVSKQVGILILVVFLLTHCCGNANVFEIL
jgi:hypothetical protein